MILECDTIGHSKYTTSKWNPATVYTDDIVLPNGNLLIRNFTDSACVSYFCILSVSNVDSKSRHYSLCPEAGLCVCVSVCVFVLMCACVCLSIDVSVYLCVYVCVSECVSVTVCVYVSVCLSISVYM